MQIIKHHYIYLDKEYVSIYYIIPKYIIPKSKQTIKMQFLTDLFPISILIDHIYGP